MDERLGWYRALSPQDRSWVGLIAHAGITEFVDWYRRPGDAVQVTESVFGAAPRELTRSISLQQTLDLLRIVVDVIEEQASLHVAPGAQQAVREAVLRFSREVAFAAAQVYARAAESRGAWDARLEALVVDALVRDEADEDLHSRAAALGWSATDRVVVIAGTVLREGMADVVPQLRRQAVAAGADVLVGVQGRRLLVVLGHAEDPLRLAPALSAYVGPGPVVTGPVVAGLADAGRSAQAAVAGLSAARARPDAPRPVAADELLPERLLDGDPLAAPELIARGYAPLAALGDDVLLVTAQTYLTAGSSIEGAARLLFVHPNTVRYRLRRVGDLTGWDPHDPREGFTLRTAIIAGLLERSAHL